MAAAPVRAPVTPSETRSTVVAAPTIVLLLVNHPCIQKCSSQLAPNPIATLLMMPLALSLALGLIIRSLSVPMFQGKFLKEETFACCSFFPSLVCLVH